MTYNEAIQKIKQHKNALDKHPKNNLLKVKTYFVAPANRDTNSEYTIFKECNEKKKDNEAVLKDMRLHNKNLIPIVVVTINGTDVFVSLDSYLNSYFVRDGKDDDKNV